MLRIPNKPTRISRRKFLRNSLTAAAGTGMLGPASQPAQKTIEPGSPKIKEFRSLGRTGFKVSDISLGAGNLTNANVLEAALDMGVNYIDTAEHYARGNSERTIGEVLKNRDRGSLFITSKLNLGMGGSSKEKLKQRFGKCLERLQTDYVDCLMIHMTPSLEQIKHEPYHDLIRELKAEGRVRFSGLSNHGTEFKLAGPIKDPMEKVISAAAEDGRFDVVLFVYNFIQKEQGERIIRTCKEKNIGVTLMKTNPVKFAAELEDMYARNKEAGRKIGDSFIQMLEEYRTHAAQGRIFQQKYGLQSPEQVRDAAIRFVLSNQDVHAVCPSINSFEDLNAYVSLSGQRLTSPDTHILAEYTAAQGRLYCRHACGQCESACPQSVPVNTIMRYSHYFTAQGRQKHAMEHYSRLNGCNAVQCEACSGACNRACPFGIPIQILLAEAHQTLTLG